MPLMQHLPPGIKVKKSPSTEAMEDLSGGFAEAMRNGLILVYIVLVLLFASFLQPITILFSLPLSIGGAILALLITGRPLSMPVIIGILMLMGIVTKNAIMIVDFSTSAMATGMPRTKAIVEAGKKRARPIIMTTIAMIAGMAPSALGLGAGAEFRSPMAIAVIGGLLVSTLAVAALRSRLLCRHGRCEAGARDRLARRGRVLPRQAAGARGQGRRPRYRTAARTGRIIGTRSRRSRFLHSPERGSVNLRHFFSERISMREDWTRTKPVLDLDEETLEGLIEPVFPGCRIVEVATVTGGLTNTNLRVRLAGRQGALLVRFYQRSGDLAHKEMVLCQMVKDHVRVPEYFHFAPENPVTGHAFAVIEWIDAAPLQDMVHRLSKDDLAGIGAALGGALARIHEFTYDHFAFFDAELKVGEPMDLSGKGLVDYLRFCLVEGRGGPRLGPKLTEQVLDFAAREGWRIEAWEKTACLVHGDFNLSNILVRGSEERGWETAAHHRLGICVFRRARLRFRQCDAAAARSCGELSNGARTGLSRRRRRDAGGLAAHRADYRSLLLRRRFASCGDERRRHPRCQARDRGAH